MVILDRLDGDVDAKAWHELASEGYTIRPFLDPSGVEALQQLRVATIPDLPGGYYISVFSTLEIRRAIFDGFQTILKDRIKTFAPGFRLVLASFVTKKAGTGNGRVALHQDSSLVDHRKDLGINVWVPLCDVNDHNGCLRVAGRSHRFNCIGSLPPLSGPSTNLQSELVPPSITSLEMKAGESCMFDTRLLHASGENRSDSDRVAAFFSLIPEDRPIRLYFRNAETHGQLDVFHVDSEFLLHFDPLQRPNAALRETMNFVGSCGHVQRQLFEADFGALHADAAVAADPPPTIGEPFAPVATVTIATALVKPESKPVSVSSSSLWSRLWRSSR